MRRDLSTSGATALAAIFLTLWSALAVRYVRAHGWQYLYGDAESHLNIARRITDSLTPGYHEVGTVWLPLPHWLMLPFAQNDALWRNGLAGAIPSALCFILAGIWFFVAVRRAFHSMAAAAAATALLALNPNLAYLQSTAMTEAVFLACLAGVLYASVCFAERPALPSAAAAGVAALAGTLTRYEGWFLIPFVVIYFLAVGKNRRISGALLFTAIAALGPLFWFGHNRWLTGDWLAFYRGPYSALTIQAGSSYPGLHNWREAMLYFATAARLCAGWPLALLGIAGLIAALGKKIVWPVVLLALPGVFYIWSMHSSGATPIYVPVLRPFTFYNTRYGLSLLPFAALTAAALVAAFDSERTRTTARIAACVIVVLAALPWILRTPCITLQESEVNSAARQQWTAQAADFLASRYRAGAGIVSSSGDVNGIYRHAGIPLRETLSVDNDLLYLAPLQRPDYLRETWAVIRENDPMRQSLLANGHYTLELRIVVKDAPAIEIYRR